jgi:serine protease AprX
MDLHGRLISSRKAPAAVAPLAILVGAALSLMGARAAAAAPPPATPRPPSITVSIAGSLIPGGSAVATVKATGGSRRATFAYSWQVNGTDVRSKNAGPGQADSLRLGGLHYGDAVRVTVTPYVGSTAGSAATATATLVDHPPTATVKLMADKGSANVLRPVGTLTATAATSDPDGDPVTVTYVWNVDGVAKRTTSASTAPSDTFTWSGLPGGAVVTVTVTPNDGTLSGTAATASSTIAEHVPRATVQLGGDIRAGGLATATATVADDDGDPVTLTYVWSVNGAVEQIDAKTTVLSDTFDLPDKIDPGAPVTVRVVPNDGYFNGSVVSDSVPAGKVAPAGLHVGYVPGADPYSMFDTTLFTGAQSWWDAGFTGNGVGVAVIDTGVTPVPGLDGSDKVVYGPDLSLDSQNANLANLDSNGHGTFMAGLIAAHPPAHSAPHWRASSAPYSGMAPDARILSVKVGATDGEVDVTQVIAAIDWVVQHRNDRGMNIRVISLSYGTNSTQSYLDDPLAYAAEQAWKAGIVVVAAAGNTGFQQGAGAPGVADPALDPFVVAVGGYDTMGTSTNADDRLGDYSASSAGCAPPACKGPDILAVGSHLQGLRDPGSFIDLNHPEGRLGDSYFRGSGTSEAAALAAGAIALILQRYPDMTPDDVKAFLAKGADALAGFDSSAQGAGEIDLFNLLDDPPITGAQQDFPPGTGLGTIEGSRGSDHLMANGVVLKGEEDIFGAPIDTAALALSEAAQASWNGGMWNGNTWSGNTWSGNSWSGNTWSTNGWFGNSWSGNTWSGNTWSGNTWSGNTWSGNSWSGNSWSGNTWSGNSWSGNSWSGGSWS